MVSTQQEKKCTVGKVYEEKKNKNNYKRKRLAGRKMKEKKGEKAKEWQLSLKTLSISSRVHTFLNHSPRN